MSRLRHKAWTSWRFSCRRRSGTKRRQQMLAQDLPGASLHGMFVHRKHRPVPDRDHLGERRIALDLRFGFGQLLPEAPFGFPPGSRTQRCLPENLSDAPGSVNALHAPSHYPGPPAPCQRPGTRRSPPASSHSDYPFPLAPRGSGSGETILFGIARPVAGISVLHDIARASSASKRPPFGGPATMETTFEHLIGFRDSTVQCNSVTFTRHAIERMFSRAIDVAEVTELIAKGEMIADYPYDIQVPCCWALSGLVPCTSSLPKTSERRIAMWSRPTFRRRKRGMTVSERGRSNELRHLQDRRSPER
jgi:hypothetical protein